jgi:hypothetical protein
LRPDKIEAFKKLSYSESGTLIHMPKTPGEMAQAIAANLQKRTGKTLEEWTQIVEASGVEGFKARLDWLRQQHGLGGSTAYIIVEHLRGRGALYESPEKLVDDQYSGSKAGLRPIYDAVIEYARRLGDDVQIRPCMGYVPIMRRVQFAVLRAATKDRVDLGLRLGDLEPSGKLLPAKNLGGGDKIKLRIALSSLKDFDAEARRWLKKAYDLNG